MLKLIQKKIIALRDGLTTILKLGFQIIKKLSANLKQLKEDELIG